MQTSPGGRPGHDLVWSCHRPHQRELLGRRFRIRSFSPRTQSVYVEGIRPLHALSEPSVGVSGPVTVGNICVCVGNSAYLWQPLATCGYLQVPTWCWRGEGGTPLLGQLVEDAIASVSCDHDPRRATERDGTAERGPRRRGAAGSGGLPPTRQPSQERPPAWGRGRVAVRGRSR